MTTLRASSSRFSSSADCPRPSSAQQRCIRTTQRARVLKRKTGEGPCPASSKAPRPQRPRVLKGRRGRALAPRPQRKTGEGSCPASSKEDGGWPLPRTPVRALVRPCPACLSVALCALAPHPFPCPCSTPLSVPLPEQTPHLLGCRGNLLFGLDLVSGVLLLLLLERRRRNCRFG